LYSLFLAKFSPAAGGAPLASKKLKAKGKAGLKKEAKAKATP